MVVVGLAAYSNSFSGPWVYDDIPAIAENPTIRSLAGSLLPPQGTTTSGRPLVNVSLALNWALGGARVAGYHVFNLLIHLAAGLALFGVVRRTLVRLGNPQALAVAALGALWWTVHPLQTESVTYLVQRAESLMGLCYFLTIYCFIRSLDATAAGRWRGGAILACLAGMASKEVMVSAPLMVWLYDRTFVAGTFREAWRRRRGFYLALAGTWVLLGICIASTGGNRGGTVGLDVGVAWWAYGLTQFRAVTHYLRLAVWPHPLVFEYGTFWESDWTAVWPGALLVVGLLVVTLVALQRRTAPGFLGAWFFVMLAPTSLVPGTTQMIVEHRMYLPLAALVVGAVAAAAAWFGRRSLGVGMLIAAVLAAATFSRNADYRSELALWSDTVEKRPSSALAHCNLAIALARAGRLTEAVEQYERSLALSPAVAETHYNFGLALAKLGREAEALAQYESAVRLNPGHPLALCNLGGLYFQAGRTGEAVACFERALRVIPNDAETHGNLANALFQAGRRPEALRHYERALTLDSGSADTHYNYANALLQDGRCGAAIVHYEQALIARPGDLDTHLNLGIALEQAGRLAEAVAHWDAALAIRPDFAPARENLARVHATSSPPVRK